MSKKAKSRRKDAYKTFLNGQVAHRNNFIQSKLTLAEKVLEDSTLKQTIESKGADMSVLERATLHMLRDREISSLEDFKTISEGIKEAQEKGAKFKYTPKKI